MTREVWITGIGMTSSLGEGLDAHWQAMAEAEHPTPVIDKTTFAPYPVHPMVPLDFSQQIPKGGDRRQMENWQRVGTYTAGLALDDAGIAGNLELLSNTNMVVAAAGGERDLAVDQTILEGVGAAESPEEFINERLSNDLRPTLFLAQLPNLVAGNIAIVHKVTGSSRTFMGEELASVSAVEIAARRIRADQGDIFLAGGAIIAERKDVLLVMSGAGWAWTGEPASVWARPEKGGGIILGSVGTFLVLEAREHAEARGAKPYARLGTVLSGRSRREPGQAAEIAAEQFAAIRKEAGDRRLAMLTSASGLSPLTQEEQGFLAGLIARGELDTVRAVPNMLGTSVEATFPSMVGLAALALSRKGFYRPADDTGFETPVTEAPTAIAVNSWGNWRGEGMGLVEAID
ncbi:beta-ketoacyl-ACP synthase [Bauldia litoralis]|uniref:3-oxoacyl-[acyl-carrier-protein] synthase II n=1 Tax=Bauldia litoralis TaxID=665467 RepID=A0A1G6EHG3_9HYPH|nr:beta-ketoacyl-ACP synthase [Bauldia litoralis]SDB56792.1 3-oxoacyl-[acyl-carrier-protein] synthase II [Bauldia litoralis]